MNDALRPENIAPGPYEETTRGLAAFALGQAMAARLLAEGVLGALIGAKILSPDEAIELVDVMTLRVEKLRPMTVEVTANTAMASLTELLERLRQRHGRI